ncbi:MAG: anthrone oxygenase family protein [Micromonosporaceae bacterium]
MLLDALSVVILLTNGLIAGVFFDVAIALVPAFFKMPRSRFVYVNNLLVDGYHPTMPILCTTAVLSNLALVFLAPAPYRYLFLSGTLLIIGTMVISEFGNMRINRRLLTVDPDNLPIGFQDPRREWRGFHLMRTSLALAAITINGTAVALVN